VHNTITMSGIANLAHVARSTVSMWRSRYDVSSDTPFPTPINNDPHQPLFDAHDIGHWLVSTKHGHNPEAIADAPFYSTSFDFIVETPAKAIEAANLLTNWDNVPPNSELTPSLAALIEAGYGTLPVLERITDRLWEKNKHKLSKDAMTVLVTSLQQIINARWVDASHPLTIIPWGPGSIPLIVQLARSHSENFPCRISEQLNSGDSTTRAIAWIELESRNITITKDFPTDSLIVAVWLDYPNDDASFFNALDDQLLNLDADGTMILIAPSKLLLDNTDPSITRARSNFLSNTATGYTAPLRYTARLPKHWAANLGKRQLGIWIFKRSTFPAGKAFPVVIAELSGISKADYNAIASDLATAALYADELGKHNFVHANITTSVKAWRKNIVALDSVTNKPLLHASPKLHASPEENILGELWLLAERAQLSFVENLPLEGNPHKSPSRPRISWRKATSGKDRVIQLIPGSRLPDGRLTDTGPATVIIIGKPELHDNTTMGSRRINRLHLENINHNAKLTQPGDVVFIKNSAHPIAWIDWEGGHVVQTPAQIARCKTKRGRSQVDLPLIATPFFVAKSINSATSTDPHSWHVSLVPKELVPLLHTIHKEVNTQRIKFQEQLASLERFEELFATSLSNGDIRTELPSALKYAN